MKSPAELKLKLRRQWESAGTREARLLAVEDVWPIVISIKRPTPKQMAADLDAVKRHVENWRRVTIGEVVWEFVSFRATSDAVELPIQWKLRRPTEWVDACADGPMREEFEALATFAERTDSIFHSLLIRRRSLWRSTPLEEVVQASRLASVLEPGCANGKPLRTLSLEGIDTKFFERNARLVTSLLDVRFDGEVSRIGLEVFLGALTEGDHWLLVMDLDGSLLPFRKQRVGSSELKDTGLPGERLLIVENETCQHQLPEAPNTIAILGAGFDLSWTAGQWLQEKHVGYWGDIDTWGLQFLAAARASVRHVETLMMSPQVYEQHNDAAVVEPVIAGAELPFGLSEPEKELYRILLKAPRGRLEQEFLPQSLVEETIRLWAGTQNRDVPL